MSETENLFQRMWDSLKADWEGLEAEARHNATIQLLLKLCAEAGLEVLSLATPVVVQKVDTAIQENTSPQVAAVLEPIAQDGLSQVEANASSELTEIMTENTPQPDPTPVPTPEPTPTPVLEPTPVVEPVTPPESVPPQ